MSVHIRVEQPKDYDAVARAHRLAFGGPEVPMLVEAIRASSNAAPDLSFVADDHGSVVGHVMFSYVTLETDGVHDNVLVLSPLSVLPDKQGQGIGSALVTYGLHRADAAGEPLVLVEGIPSYYPRFGFEPFADWGIEAVDPRVPDAFMVRPLSSYDPRYRGRLVYPPYFISG